MKKILVIDDDPVLVKYLVSLFQSNGYATCEANSSHEGLEVVQREKPDLITLDLQMDDEWGPKFYRKLILHEEFKNIPIIVVSGLSGQHAIKKAVAFVGKPFDPDRLLGIVRNTIGLGG